MATVDLGRRVEAVLRLRSGCGGARVADACFKLPEDLCGHVELSGHGDGLADSARRTKALELPTSSPQDSLHTHVDHTDNRANAVGQSKSQNADQQFVGRS